LFEDHSPDTSEHGTITLVLKHIDRLLRKGVSGLAKDLPTGEEGDKGGLGDVAPKGEEDGLSGRDNLLADTVSGDHPESERVSDGGHVRKGREGGDGRGGNSVDDGVEIFGCLLFRPMSEEKLRLLG
jgi:hypothetical protein